MKLKEELKKSGRKSKYAHLVLLPTIIYLIMVLIKSLYFWSADSQLAFVQKLHFGLAVVISKTSILFIGSLWSAIPTLISENNSLIAFYKVLIYPAIVMFICGLFIADHRAQQRKYFEVKTEVEKEKDLNDMRKELGLETVSKDAIVDIVIDNKTQNITAWHNTGWGKVVIAIIIALILSVIGLK